MLTESAIALIKRYEGWARKLPDGRAAPYRCPAGVWTIGYGATFDLTGAAITGQTAPITLAEGERLLMAQLVLFEKGVWSSLPLGAQLNANQLGSLTSFAFNLGLGRLRSSTLLARVKQGNFQSAANEFPKWVYAGGQRLKGLVLRRTDERTLFLTPVQIQSAPETVGLLLSAPTNDNALQAGWLTRFKASFNDAFKTG